MSNRVLVALSGGIDSAATVLMLRERGFEVEGLYIDMLGNEESCQKAIAVAEKLRLKLHVENVVEEFQEKIISYTLSEHQAGRTPSPCVRCNPLIKWAVAERVADREGIFHIATGHYVRIVDSMIYKGVDPAKDQSYYLWGVSASILKRAVTPLGDFTKQMVRDYLSKFEGFSGMASGGESMSICFTGCGTYNEFLTNNLNPCSGNVVNDNGEIVGRHSGFQLYTIGQKRGFTGGGAVVGVDSSKNQVNVSVGQSKLYTDTIDIRNWVFADLDIPVDQIEIKIRGIGRNPQSGIKSIVKQDDNSLRIVLNKADAWAVAEGQPVVFYIGDRVVGGGIVENV